MELVRQVRSLGEVDTPELEIAAREIALERERRLSVQAAITALLREVGAGRVTAYGRLDRNGPPSMHVAVPVELFMDSTVTITTHDRIQQDARLGNGGINGGAGYYDVQFKTAEVLAIWPKRVQPSGTAEQGAEPPNTRPPPFDYRGSDSELVEEMKRLIDTGAATGPMNAARAVAGRAAGKGSEESKVKRLLARWKRLHSE